ncbi:hypothetical protein [Streptomyces sp. MCL20-2]|nr:hypothetical protein [Streptomyces sp. MCL20-2]
MVDDDTWSGALHRLWQAASDTVSSPSLGSALLLLLVVAPGV